MIQSDDDMYESAKESLARRELMALGVTCEEIIFIIDRLRQAEKDAARYRWLRNCDTVESKKFVSESGGWIVGLSVLDGLIDEAMNA